MTPQSPTIKTKSSYKNPNIKLLYGLGRRVIREFDMNSAGLSTIRAFKLLSPKVISYLESLPKKERNIVIGKIRGADKEFGKVFLEKVRQVMVDFMTENRIDDTDIISINNDAVTVVMNREVQYNRVIDNVTFKVAGEFDTFAALGNISVFVNSITRDITIKGISEDARQSTRQYLQEILVRWMSRLGSGQPPMSVLKEILRFREKLWKHELPVGYYRSMRTGMLSVKDDILPKYSSVFMQNDFEEPEWHEKLDPTPVNYDILIPLQSLILEAT